MNKPYEFSVDWFTANWPNWLEFTADRKVSKILEIGSFEGCSTCTMIEHFSQASPLDVYCVDDWAGGIDHADIDMQLVELRFDHNIKLAIQGLQNPVKVNKHKGKSIAVLAALIAGRHQGTFDLVYVDGSHQAPDVLGDLVLGYYLCAVGGVMICDDYLWTETPHGREDLLAMPRPAIDAFANLFIRKMALWRGLPLYQVYFQKTG